ncbi:MAG: DMT family transporter [Deferrisomatales bacterium]
MGQGALYLKLVLTAVLWGGTFIAGRILAREVPPFSAAFLRFVVASGILWAFLWRVRGKVPALGPRQMAPTVLLGLTGVFAYNALFFLGLQTVPASRASLIIANNPVFIAVGSALFFRERLGLLRIAGLALALCGALTVISGGDLSAIWRGGVGRGEWCILGCVVSWTLYSLVGKVALRDLPPLVAVSYACAIGAALLSVPALWEGVLARAPSYSLGAWLAIAYLGVCGSALAFIWYYQGIRAIGPARAGVFINLVPVSGVILAFALLGETLDRSVVAGGALVAVGVWLTNRAGAGGGAPQRAGGAPPS